MLPDAIATIVGLRRGDQEGVVVSLGLAEEVLLPLPRGVHQLVAALGPEE